MSLITIVFFVCSGTPDYGWRNAHAHLKIVVSPILLLLFLSSSSSFFFLFAVAPEVLKGEGYNQAVDMWAIGVLTYILLCGYPPFYDKVQAKLFQKIMSVSYKFHENEWKDISVQAKDFISKLLVEQPTLRNSAVQSLRHKWLQVNAPTSSSGSEAANPKNLRSLPTTHHLEVYRKARKVRQADVSDMESAQSESSGTSTPTGSKRHSISHQKAEKGLREKLVGFKMGKTGASKRDKSYQAILLGSKHTPVELSDGWFARRVPRAAAKTHSHWEQATSWSTSRSGTNG